MVGWFVYMLCLVMFVVGCLDWLGCIVECLLFICGVVCWFVFGDMFDDVVDIVIVLWDLGCYFSIDYLGENVIDVDDVVVVVWVYLGFLDVLGCCGDIVCDGV